MRSKLTALIGSLACAAAIVPAMVLGTPSAQAASARPATSAVHSVAPRSATPSDFIFSGSKTFTPQSSTYSQSDSNGRLEASYNYHEGIFGWRYEVNPALCRGGTGAVATADIYNRGGLIPNTHYSKIDKSPCYGFHAAFQNPKINQKGNYQLRGIVKWREGNATLTLTFRFNFLIAYV